MNLKQTNRLVLSLTALLVGVTILSSLTSATVMADPATTSVKCKDGKTVTAHKDAKPDKSILDDKDYAYACRNNGGYKAPATPADSSADTGSAATDPIAGTDCGGVETAIIKCDAKNSGSTEDNGIWALLLLVVNILTAGVGVVAVGGIVYGSILYTTAEDKADQVKKATDIIRNVIIGLVLYALMYGLLNFIVPGGVFS